MFYMILEITRSQIIITSEEMLDLCKHWKRSKNFKTSFGNIGTILIFFFSLSILNGLKKTPIGACNSWYNINSQIPKMAD